MEVIENFIKKNIFGIFLFGIIIGFCSCFVGQADVCFGFLCQKKWSIIFSPTNFIYWLAFCATGGTGIAIFKQFELQKEDFARKLDSEKLSFLSMEMNQYIQPNMELPYGSLEEEFYYNSEKIDGYHYIENLNICYKNMLTKESEVESMLSNFNSMFDKIFIYLSDNIKDKIKNKSMDTYNINIYIIKYYIYFYHYKIFDKNQDLLKKFEQLIDIKK